MKKLATKKMFLVLGLVVLIVGISGYFILNRNNGNTPGSNINQVNYGPPTEEEKQAADDQKAINEARDETVTNANPGTNANLVLVDADQYFDVVEVRAYVSNIYEDGGTCTATFTKDSQTIKESSAATRDAKTTQCGSIDIPRSKFPTAGQWQLVVSYSSPNASGSLPPKTVTLK